MDISVSRDCGNTFIRALDPVDKVAGIVVLKDALCDVALSILCIQALIKSSTVMKDPFERLCSILVTSVNTDSASSSKRHGQKTMARKA